MSVSIPIPQIEKLKELIKMIEVEGPENAVKYSPVGYDALARIAETIWAFIRLVELEPGRAAPEFYNTLEAAENRWRLYCSEFTTEELRKKDIYFTVEVEVEYDKSRQVYKVVDVVIEGYKCQLIFDIKIDKIFF